MTRGHVFHGVPSDFFLYKLEEQFKDNCNGAVVSLGKSSRTVRVCTSLLKHALEVTFGEGFELEINCGSEKKSGEFIPKRGHPSFETDYSISVQIGAYSHSFWPPCRI